MGYFENLFAAMCYVVVQVLLRDFSLTGCISVQKTAVLES